MVMIIVQILDPNSYAYCLHFGKNHQQTKQTMNQIKKKLKKETYIPEMPKNKKVKKNPQKQLRG